MFVFFYKYHLFCNLNFFFVAGEHLINICLAQSRHRRKGFMGKAILQDAQEMKDIITGKALQEKQEGEK